MSLPTGLRGNASRTSISRGISTGESLSLRNPRNSSSVRMAPERGSTKAAGASPRYSSGMPTTVTAATPGWRYKASSIVRG